MAVAPGLPTASCAEDASEPDEPIGELDLRGLRGYVDRDEDLWPTLVLWDVDGAKVELTAGMCGWQERRELAAQGAEHLAAVALAFAKEIREYRP